MPITLRDADNAIERIFAAEGFQGRLEYDRSKVIETARWWYIPFGWIGCAGFIVNKDDLYVNWLGSAHTIEDCFWGHDHGIFCDWVDFTFAPDTDLTLVARLLLRFKHISPDESEGQANDPEWYRSSEIPEAISNHFPRFSYQMVWFAIPELRRAYEHEGLRFTCELSKRV